MKEKLGTKTDEAVLQFCLMICCVMGSWVLFKQIIDIFGEDIWGLSMKMLFTIITGVAGISIYLILGYNLKKVMEKTK